MYTCILTHTLIWVLWVYLLVCILTHTLSIRSYNYIKMGSYSIGVSKLTQLSFRRAGLFFSVAHAFHISHRPTEWYSHFSRKIHHTNNINELIWQQKFWKFGSLVVCNCFLQTRQTPRGSTKQPLNHYTINMIPNAGSHQPLRPPETFSTAIAVLIAATAPIAATATTVSTSDMTKLRCCPSQVLAPPPKAAGTLRLGGYKAKMMPCVSWTSRDVS